MSNSLKETARHIPGVGRARMILVVATVAQRYRLHLVPGQPVEPQVLFTMRPRDRLMVTVEPRWRA